jgi:2-aminomuconate deaminase
MPFGGFKSSGVAREGGMYSLDFFSEESTICMKLGNRTPPPMPGRAARAAAATVAPPPPRLAVGAAVTALRGAVTARSSGGFARQGGGVRALNTGATGYVASAPKPMGAYAHAREAGGLLFLAGIGPRDPATDSVPGGPVEAADGTLNDYDARAQTRQCIQNVRTVLEAHGLGLDAVVDVHAFLVDMKRDFAAFNAEYAAAFGKLPEPPVRTTVEVGQLPPGGRIAVELKVIAKAPSVYFVPGGIPDCVKE